MREGVANSWQQKNYKARLTGCTEESIGSDVCFSCMYIQIDKWRWWVMDRQMKKNTTSLKPKLKQGIKNWIFLSKGIDIWCCIQIPHQNGHKHHQGLVPHLWKCVTQRSLTVSEFCHSMVSWWSILGYNSKTVCVRYTRLYKVDWRSEALDFPPWSYTTKSHSPFQEHSPGQSSRPLPCAVSHDTMGPWCFANH